MDSYNLFFFKSRHRNAKLGLETPTGFFAPEEKHELYPTAELFGVAMSIVSGKLREFEAKISTWQVCKRDLFQGMFFFCEPFQYV